MDSVILLGKVVKPARPPDMRPILEPRTAKPPTKEGVMPRIIVTADPVSSEPSDETPVLLDEQVRSVHLSTGHAAAQLVERLAWAVSDAEHAEVQRSARASDARSKVRSARQAQRPRTRDAVRA
jgi:hypothetical protein